VTYIWTRRQLGSGRPRPAAAIRLSAAIRPPEGERGFPWLQAVARRPARVEAAGVVLARCNAALAFVKSNLHHRGRQDQDQRRLKLAARVPLTSPEAVNIHPNISAKYKLPGRHAQGAPGLNS
jgi:hypothetical protein